MKSLNIKIIGIVYLLVVLTLLYPNYASSRIVRDTELFLQLRQSETLGERISIVRNYRRLTQEVLAGMLGVQREFIAQLENDYYLEPSHSYIVKLAQELNIDVWRLLTGFEKKEALERKNLLPLITPVELTKWGE